MRLLILSMPAVALVAVLSVSLQHSMSHNSRDMQEALPEATAIYKHVMTHRAAMKGFTPLSAKAPITISPAINSGEPDWN